MLVTVGPGAGDEHAARDFGRAVRVASRVKLDSEVREMALIRWSVLVAVAGLTFACSSSTQPGNTIGAPDINKGAGGNTGLGGVGGDVMCFSNCNASGAVMGAGATMTGAGGIMQVCGGQAVK